MSARTPTAERQRGRAGRRAGRGVAALLAAALLAACSTGQSSSLTVTGTVDDTTSIVAVPALVKPTVNVDAGFPSDPADSAGQAGAKTADPAATVGLGSILRITSVKVREGDSVEAGQVVATLDTRLLKAQLEVAKADQKAAAAQVDALAAAIDTTYDKEKEIADKRSEVEDGIAKATKARKELSGKLAEAKKAQKELPKQLAKVQKTLTELKAQRAKAQKQLDIVNAALAALPPDAPPAIRDPLEQAQAKLTAGLKKLDAGIAKLTAARKQLTAAIKQVNVGIPKLTRAIATIDSNLAKARDGLRKLDKAADKIRDARATLKDAKKLAVIRADAAGIPVSQARAQLNQATLTAPVAGVVVRTARNGDLLAPGAGVVEIRPADASTITAWLSPAQAAQVCPGDAVQITGDWMAAGSSAAGSLTWLGSGYQYPPTDSTTDEIHLTRALAAQFTTSATQLPAGAPVDISIAGCRPAAQTETNG